MLKIAESATYSSIKYQSQSKNPGFVITQILTESSRPNRLKDLPLKDTNAKSRAVEFIFYSFFY